MASYNSSQKPNSLSLLAQLSSRQVNACLQVFSGSVFWSIYLEQGKLIYATDSVNPFERLDRHLRRLSAQIPTLVSAVRVQVCLLFESDLESQSSLNPEYQAICWLVNQQYLSRQDAAKLIEELAEEVIVSLLSVKEGNYQLIEQKNLEGLPVFCYLDLLTIFECCYEQLRIKQSSASTNVTRDPARGSSGENSAIHSHDLKP